MGIGSRIETKIQHGAIEEAKHTESDIKLTQAHYQLSDLILPATTSSSIADFLAYQQHEHLIFNQWGLTHTHKHPKLPSNSNIVLSHQSEKNRQIWLLTVTVGK